MPIDLIATAFDLIIGQGLELAKDKAKRSERILKILNTIGLKQDAPPANDFNGVYAYTLVVYGIDKPKLILEFFRHQFIKDAFWKSFEKRDLTILEEEAINFLDWNEIGKDILAVDYDPKREFAEFREQFINAAKLTRTVQEVLVDHTLDNISGKLNELPTREDFESLAEVIQQKEALANKTTRTSQGRILEAAIEKEVTVGRSAQLFALIRRLDSKGLISIINSIDEEIVLDEGNVKSKGFSIEFPIEKDQILHTDIILKLESHDFSPQTQYKNIIIPPDGDSEVCTFIITPQKTGRLILNLEVLGRDKLSLATRTLRTNAIEDEQRSHSVNLVTIPIFVMVEMSRPNVNIQIDGSIQGNIVVGDENIVNNSSDLDLLPRNDLKEELLAEISKDLISNLCDEVNEIRSNKSTNESSKRRDRTPPFSLFTVDNSFFVGRESELMELKKLAFNQETSSYSKIICITGKKGVGKSSLASMFAHKYRDRFPDGVIGLRIDGRSLEEIAYHLASFIGEQISPNLGAHEIMQKVFEDRQALLIFDNVDNANIQELMPGGNRCTIIVATQNPRLLDNQGIAGQIELKNFSLNETSIFLALLIGRERVITDLDSVGRIHKMVGGLPLAVKIVGLALINEEKITLSEYIDRLEHAKKPLHLHDLDDESLFWIDDSDENG